eukprot:2523590-Pyramimonas_sp.AAC.1
MPLALRECILIRTIRIVLRCAPRAATTLNIGISQDFLGELQEIRCLFDEVRELGFITRLRRPHDDRDQLVPESVRAVLAALGHLAPEPAQAAARDAGRGPFR